MAEELKKQHSGETILPMSPEKQLELMFIDVNEVILDAKTQLSQLMRWVVTLNSGIILLFFSSDFSFSDRIYLAPIFVTVCGLLLSFALMAELESHRKSLADIRHAVGDKMQELHGEFIDEYYQKKTSLRGWLRATRTWLEIVVILFSGVATLLIILLE